MYLKTALPAEHFRHETGHCWFIDCAGIGLDKLKKGGLIPRVTVFEDGRPIGPSNAIHDEIRYHGYGRVAVTGGRLYFSTSDNTDPRSNGREYVVEATQHDDGTPLPPPRVMHVAITGSCNMTCRICRTEDNAHGATIKDPVLDKVIAEALPHLQELRLDSAGETTLHKPKFRLMVSQAARHGVPVFMCTNAVLIDEEMADFICKDTSVKRIQVSCDSPDRETLEWIRRGANYDELLAGIRNLVAARKRHDRPDILINMHAAIMAQNVDQQADLIRLAHELGVDQVSTMFCSIHEYMDADWSVYWHQQRNNDATDEAARVAADLGINYRPWGRFDLAAKPDSTTPTQEATALCYQLQHWTYLDPNGIIRPCCISPNFALGDLNVKTFTEVWHGEEYEELRRTYDTDHPSNPTCAKCYIRVGWNQNSYKSYFASDHWPKVRQRLGLPDLV